jgi:ankyrin repeat protein
MSFIYTEELRIMFSFFVSKYKDAKNRLLSPQDRTSDAKTGDTLAWNTALAGDTEPAKHVVRREPSSLTAASATVQAEQHNLTSDAKAEDTLIWNAALAGDIESVKRLVRTESSALTAIRAAAQAEQHELSNYLFQQYPAATKSVVSELAQQGQFALVEYLASKQPALRTIVIKSAIRENHRDWLDRWMKKNPSQIHIVQKCAGLEDNLDYAQYLITQSDDDAVSHIAWGAGRSGKAEKTLAYLLDHYKSSLRSAMNGAAFAGDINLVKKLLAMNGSLDSARGGAIVGQSLKMVKYLIDLDKATLFGYTQYWGNAYIGQIASIEVVGLLIDEGASPTVIAGVAAMYGETKMVEYLVNKRGANRDAAIAAATKNGHSALANSLRSAVITEETTKRGLKAEAFFLSSRKALITSAARTGDLELVTRLVKDAYPKFLFEELNEILSIAAETGQIAIVKYLISQGVSVANAVTALIEHKQFADETHAVNSLVRRLAKGSRPKFLSNKLNEILSIAAKTGQIAVVEYLVNQGVSVANAVTALTEHKQFADEIHAVRSLASINRHLRNKFVKEAEKNESLQFDWPELLRQADTLNILMHESRISLNQAIAWRAPVVREILKYCSSAGDLPCSIYFLIATFFFPVGGNEEDARKLFAHAKREGIFTVNADAQNSKPPADTKITKQYDDFAWKPKNGFSCTFFDNCEDLSSKAPRAAQKQATQAQASLRAHAARDSSSISSPHTFPEGRGMKILKEKVHQGVLKRERDEKLLEQTKKGGVLSTRHGMQ